MSIKFSDKILKRYYSELVNDLRNEFHFLEQILANQAVVRPDAFEKYVNSLSMVLESLGCVIPFASILSNSFSVVISILQSRRTDQVKGFMISLDKYSQRLNEVCFSNIAYETVYQYGQSLLNLLHQNPSLNVESTVDILSRIGAMRIINFVVIYNIDLKDCSHALAGLMHGCEEMNFEFYEFCKMIKIIGREEIFVDQFYGNCGIVQCSGMDYCFYIDKRIGQKFKSQQKVVYVNNVGKDVPRSQLIPKYGYVALPQSEALPIAYGLQSSSYAVASLLPIQSSYLRYVYRYVSLELIEEYLRYCKTVQQANPTNASTPSNGIDFTSWLMKTFPSFFQASNTAAGSMFIPIFRGHIDEAMLNRKELSFSYGTFRYCDFSYSFLTKLPITELSYCRLYHCHFDCCVVKAPFALHYSSLCMSKLTKCNFSGLQGFLDMKFADISDSQFRYCQDLRMEFDELDMDYPTAESFKERNVMTITFLHVLTLDSCC